MCPKHYSRCWGYSRKQINTNPCSQKLISRREKEAIGEKVSSAPGPWCVYGCLPISRSCLLTSQSWMLRPCHKHFALGFICEYLRLFQKEFQAASLPFGLTASKCLVSSPAMCCDFLPRCRSAFPSRIHLLPGPFRVPFFGAGTKSRFSNTCDYN